MRSLVPALAAALLVFPLAPAWAGGAGDAANALNSADAQVRALDAQVRAFSSVSGANVNSVTQVQGQLAALKPFFNNLVQQLSGLHVSGCDQLVSLSGDLSAKIQTAQGASTVNIGVLITACQGIAGDFDQWKALEPQVLAGLQQLISQGGAAAVVQAVATAIPAPSGGWVPQPTAPPTPIPPTPVPAATATPIIVATPIPLPPAGNGGLIPGGFVPQPPTPTPQPTPLPGLPTPTPATNTGRGAKAPLPVAAAHNGQSVWVANVQANSVAVMDTASQRFTASLPVGANPSSLGLDDGDNTLAVANAGGASVTLIDARGVKVLKTLAVGATPAQVLVNHAGKAYVACQDGRSVAVIDLNHLVLIKIIALSSRPGRMDEPNGGGSVYVSLPDEDAVAVIDSSIDDVVATVRE